MFHFNLLHSSLSIIFLFFACVYAAEPWPGPGDGPQNLKAFPSKVDCRLEVVFERDDKNYAYSVYGLYDNSNGPIKLQPFEVQDGSTWPITVINGDSNDDVGAYQELASNEANERYTPLIVNKCAEDVDHGNFQNQIFIRANPGGQGGVDVWESDHVIVKDEFIPSPGVTLNSVTAEKNLVLEANPGDDLSYTVNLEWSVEKFHAKEVLGFWTLASYRGSGTHFTNSLYWPLKDQYGGPNNGSGYVNFKVPADFDYDNDQHFFAAVSVQTTEGAFSDPVTCPQKSFTIPKENPQ